MTRNRVHNQRRVAHGFRKGPDLIERGRERDNRSEEHTSELQSHLNLVCRLLLEKNKQNYHSTQRVASDTGRFPHQHEWREVLVRCYHMELQLSRESPAVHMQSTPSPHSRRLLT